MRRDQERDQERDVRRDQRRDLDAEDQGIGTSSADTGHDNEHQAVPVHPQMKTASCGELISVPPSLDPQERAASCRSLGPVTRRPGTAGA